MSEFAEPGSERGIPPPKRPRNLARGGERAVERVNPGWPPRGTGLSVGVLKSALGNVFLGDNFVDGLKLRDFGGNARDRTG